MTMDWTSAGSRGEPGPTLSRGTTQSGVRIYNERLALSLIRLHGSLPKAEIAKLTGLSAQTVSVIVRQLEADNLLVRGQPQRGKVGQPLVPFALNPDGAYSIGLKVGRRSGDLMLLDLTGKVRNTIHQPYHFPAPGEIIDFVRGGVASLLSELTDRQKLRVSGLGIAAPFELWNWEEEAGAPHDVLEAWRGFDLAREIGGLFDWPVHICNDATAACAAELLFGKGRALRDYGYFYIGYFVGGGIVINGSLYQGRNGNAGALGSFPIPAASGGSRQLIHTASLHVLEKALSASGKPSDLIWQNMSAWHDAGSALEAWIDVAAVGLAHASVGVASVLDTAAIVIDGAMPANVREQLVKSVTSTLSTIDMQGISHFDVVAGSIGAEARALGAASLPLFDNFMIDRDVLFKETP